MVDTYRGAVLPEGSRVERRTISPNQIAVKVSMLGARQAQYAVFEAKQHQWRSTGELLSTQEVNDRVRLSLGAK